MAKKRAETVVPEGADLKSRLGIALQRLAEGVWPATVLVVHGESDTFNGYLMLVSDATDADELAVSLAHVPVKVRHEILVEVEAGQRRGIVETEEWQYHWALLQGGGPAGVKDLTIPPKRAKHPAKA